MGWLGKLGLTVKDLFSGGAEIYDMISDNRAAAKSRTEGNVHKVAASPRRAEIQFAECAGVSIFQHPYRQWLFEPRLDT